MARPTNYTPEIIAKANEYKNILRPTDDEVIPSIEGLALYIDIARSTIYDWISQEDKQEFSDIVSKILEDQAKTLINKGLTGKFNQSITKVMMSKHGYREGIEQMGKDGEKLTFNITNYVDDKPTIQTEEVSTPASQSI